MTETIGVAISSTGERLEFLETCVTAWRKVLPLGSVLVVTVDGDDEACDRAYEAYDPSRFGNLYQIGQPTEQWYSPFGTRDGRIGVAANKNTGIELLMTAGVDHLFLSDDDTWPTHEKALGLHTGPQMPPHSMVCWGRNRLTEAKRAAGYATWSWPRGVMMYAHRSVIERVGGMVEAFGPGGHEHVEWSNRIFAANLTPAQYVSPLEYAHNVGHGANVYWNCEDMPKRGEPFGLARARKRRITTVRRTPDDWPQIEKIMEEQVGDSGFVPYSARSNGRSSATLWTQLLNDQGVGHQIASAQEPGRA